MVGKNANAGVRYPMATSLDWLGCFSRLGDQHRLNRRMAATNYRKRGFCDKAAQRKSISGCKGVKALVLAVLKKPILVISSTAKLSDGCRRVNKRNYYRIRML